MRDHISGHIPLRSNHLLARIPADEFDRLKTGSETVELKFGANIYDLGTDIDHAYFPNAGIISLLAAFDQRSTLEVGIVGSEGMVGLPLFLGVNQSRVKAIVQAHGTAVRITATVFLEECEKGGTLSRTMRRFAHSRIVQISQSALCLRFHVIEMRLARWLLMTSDRIESNELPMTQEFLSNMLGVRREAVNRAAVVLQRRALISYSRNNILIIDRLGLEATACVCYSTIRDEPLEFPPA